MRRWRRRRRTDPAPNVREPGARNQQRLDPAAQNAPNSGNWLENLLKQLQQFFQNLSKT